MTRLCSLLLLIVSYAHASVIPCDQVQAAVRIARAGSLKTITAERAKAPGSYIVDLVAAYRAFELPRTLALAVDKALGALPPKERESFVTYVLDPKRCRALAVPEPE